MIDKNEIYSWVIQLPQSKLRTTILELLAELEALEVLKSPPDQFAKAYSANVEKLRKAELRIAELESALATTTSTEPVHDILGKLRRLCDGGKFDLTDSPKSFVSAVTELLGATSTEPAKEPAACNSALRAEPAGYQEFTDAEIEAWQNAAVRGVLSAQGQSDYLNGEPIKLYPSDLRDLMDTAVGAAVGAREAAAAGAARQGGVTCNNIGTSPAADVGGLTRYEPVDVGVMCKISADEIGLNPASEYVKYADVCALLATKAEQAPAPSAKQEPSDGQTNCTVTGGDTEGNRVTVNMDSKPSATLWTMGKRAYLAESGAAPSASASPAAPEAQQQESEPARPDILENLMYHAHERDDMTIEELLQTLSAEGYRKVHQRTHRQLELQLLALLAGAAPVAGSQQVPGCKLVPLEADDDMVSAACEAANLFRVDAMRAIEAAIAAAPAVPVPAEQDQAQDEQPIECWSADEEDFNCTALGELLDRNEDLKPGSVVWVGEAVTPKPSQIYDASDVVDHMADRAYDIAGEHADGYPEIGPVETAELQAMIDAWILKHARPTFYTVRNIKPRTLTADDFLAAVEAAPSLQQGKEGAGRCRSSLKTGRVIRTTGRKSGPLSLSAPAAAASNARWRTGSGSHVELGLSLARSRPTTPRCMTPKPASTSPACAWVSIRSRTW